MRIYGHPTILELDTRYDPDVSFHVADLIRFMTDASNFENSTFWDKNATSGIGGWGEPDDDFQITDGGFSSFSVSYPSPHRVRRQYTPIIPGPPIRLLANRFTLNRQMAIVNGFVGDFIGFQTATELGPHGAVHNIVGGCVDLFSALLFRPLTEHTQRSFWVVPFNRSCRLSAWHQVVCQWCASNRRTYPGMRSSDI